MVEKTAPEGFVLNHDRSEVAFVYADQDTPVIEQEVTVGDDRQKVAIQVEKQDAENGATVVIPVCILPLPIFLRAAVIAGAVLPLASIRTLI